MSATRPRFLICPPAHFRIDEVRNLWMPGQIGRTGSTWLMTQRNALREALAECAEVDIIEPAVVTKLADRGSLESVGIVTDVGLFLSMLCTKLGLTPDREAVVP